MEIIVPVRSTWYNISMNMIYGFDDSAKYRYILRVECSGNKGIGMIKERVMTFAKQQINTKMYDFKSIILYDADHLTSDAQYSLRRCIEQYSNNTRFFMVCVNKYKLLNPICSRFTHIYLCNSKNSYIIPKEIDPKRFQHNIITLRKSIEKSMSLSVKELFDFVNDLYLKGYMAEQVKLCFRKHKKYDELNFQFSDKAHEFMNEEMTMFYILIFFRSNSDNSLSK